jgi:uncharacterized protein (DUF1786 family)
MWLFEFLFGMFLAYLLLSPKLRHFLFHRNHTPDILNRIAAEEEKEQADKSPAFAMPKAQNGSIVLENVEQVKAWMKANPQLHIKG